MNRLVYILIGILALLGSAKASAQLPSIVLKDTRGQAVNVSGNL